MHPYMHSFMHPSIHASIYLHPSMHPSIYPYIHESIHPSMYPYMHSFMHLSNHISMHPSMHLSFHPCIHSCIPLYIHPDIDGSIQPSMHPGIYHLFSHSCICPYSTYIDSSRHPLWIHPSMHWFSYQCIHLFIHASIQKTMHPFVCPFPSLFWVCSECMENDVKLRSEHVFSLHCGISGWPNELVNDC